MTTLAYRDGVLAADTMATVGNTKLPGRVRKVWKFKDGRLFGGAGTMENIRSLKKLMSAHGSGELPSPKFSDVEAILVMPNGHVMTYEGAVWEEEDSPYIALGSGYAYALTALWLGGTPQKAVQAGIQFDKCSGGGVMTVGLDQIPKAKRGNK